MIDFSNVKKVTIPEGEVKKIEWNGLVLWQKSNIEIISSLLPYVDWGSTSREYIEEHYNEGHDWQMWEDDEGNFHNACTRCGWELQDDDNPPEECSEAWVDYGYTSDWDMVTLTMYNPENLNDTFDITYDPNGDDITIPVDKVGWLVRGDADRSVELDGAFVDPDKWYQTTANSRILIDKDDIRGETIWYEYAFLMITEVYEVSIDGSGSEPSDPGNTVTWEKYSCEHSSNSYYSQQLVNEQHHIPGFGNSTLEVSAGYSFSEEDGLSEIWPTYEVPVEDIVGYYWVSPTEARYFTYVEDNGDGTFYVEYTLVATAVEHSGTDSYEKGAYIETITAAAGAVPEAGEVVSGSINGDKCVIRTANGTYFYYVRATQITFSIYYDSEYAMTSPGSLFGTFTAIEGMTWREWCNSSYNTSALHITNWNIHQGGIAYDEEIVATNNSHCLGWMESGWDHDPEIDSEYEEGHWNDPDEQIVDGKSYNIICNDYLGLYYDPYE